VKLAVAGKGGVGKTTLCAALAHAFARQGRKVMAVDADPNNCLGPALGFPADLVASITPICEMRELLCERAGTSQGGGFFSLDPAVDDLIERFSVTHDGIRLLVMGTITQGGAGCVCPESTVLRALTRQIVTGAESVLLLDMEAGLEHLGRGTSRHMDGLVIVVEPTHASARTAERIAALARDLGLRALFIVANKVREPGDAAFVREQVHLPLIGALPFIQGLGWRGDEGLPLEFTAAVEQIKAHLETEFASLQDAPSPPEAV
jgi:CO dehydrogenase maturation factor